LGRFRNLKVLRHGRPGWPTDKAAKFDELCTPGWNHKSGQAFACADADDTTRRADAEQAEYAWRAPLPHF
jgi:hypothetical protein